ncbi:MAG: hypothetical protein ACREOD_00760 [Candidatus Dormibacteria bacterium]
MAETPARNECTLYLPGHQVHWIQGLHSGSEPRNPRPGRIVGIRGRRLWVDLGGEQRRYRNHDPARLQALVRANGSEVVVDEGWSILRVPDRQQPGAHYCFSISPADEPWQRCLTDQLETFDAASLAERALSHGGFQVPAGLIRAKVRSSPPPTPKDSYPN